jgi:hypothetical protein
LNPIWTETGGMRRVHLRGHNILKWLLVQASGFNLALIMRKLIGVGKPRRLHGVYLQLLTLVRCFSTRSGAIRSWWGWASATL